MQRLRRRTRPLVIAAVLVPFLTAACGKTVGETIDDATITARVKTALLNDPDVAGTRIDVDTFKGIVTLSGSVKSKAEEAKAIGVARKISGVKDVKSTLQVATETTTRSLLPRQPRPSLPLLEPDPLGRHAELSQ